MYVEITAGSLFQVGKYTMHGSFGDSFWMIQVVFYHELRLAEELTSCHGYGVPPRKPTWQWKILHLKMHFLLNCFKTFLKFTFYHEIHHLVHVRNLCPKPMKRVLHHQK